MNCQYLKCCGSSNVNMQNGIDLFIQNIVFEKGYCEDGYAGTIATDDLRVFAPDVVERDYAVGYFNSKKKLKYFITLGDKTLDEAIEVAKSKVDDDTMFVLIAPTYKTYLVGGKDFIVDVNTPELINNVFNVVNDTYLDRITEIIKKLIDREVAYKSEKYFTEMENKIKKIQPNIYLGLGDKFIKCNELNKLEVCGLRLRIKTGV